MKSRLIAFLVCGVALLGQALAQTPSAGELAQVNQKLAVLAKAFSDKAVLALEPHLSAAVNVSGFEGDLARKVLAAAIAQVGDARLDGAVITKTAQGYHVALAAREGAPPRDLKLNEAFLFTEINLFSASVKQSESTRAKLVKQPASVSARFELHKRLIVLKDVQLDGAPATFVLDTGSPVMVLNSGVISAAQGSQASAQGINGQARLDVLELKSFSWQGFEMGAIKLVATDLSAIEQSLGFKVHGLIGYDFLKDYELVIDYAALRLELHRPHQTSGASGGSPIGANSSSVAGLRQGRPARVVVPFEMRGHLPIVSAKLAGLGATPIPIPASFALDTGASANVIDTALFARLAADAYTELETTQVSGVGSSAGTLAGSGAQTQAFTLKSLVLSGSEFAQMKTVSHSVAHLNTKPGSTPIDGILGYELLSKSLVAINFPERQLKFY